MLTTFDIGENGLEIIITAETNKEEAQLIAVMACRTADPTVSQWATRGGMGLVFRVPLALEKASLATHE